MNDSRNQLAKIRQYSKVLKTMRKSRELIAKTDCQRDVTLEQVTAEILGRIDINIMVIEQRMNLISRQMMTAA